MPSQFQPNCMLITSVSSSDKPAIVPFSLDIALEQKDREYYDCVISNFWTSLLVHFTFLASNSRLAERINWLGTTEANVAIEGTSFSVSVADLLLEGSSARCLDKVSLFGSSRINR